MIGFYYESIRKFVKINVLNTIPVSIQFRYYISISFLNKILFYPIFVSKK